MPRSYDGHKRHSLGLTGMKYVLTSYATRLQNETIPRGPFHKLERCESEGARLMR